jgi:hypothetical protein
MDRSIKNVQENTSLAMEFHPKLPLLSFCKLTQTTHTLSILGIYSPPKKKPYAPPPLAPKKLKIVMSISTHDNFQKVFDLDLFICSHLPKKFDVTNPHHNTLNGV